MFGEVGAQASHGVGEAAHAHTDERALFCLAQVFVPALHFASYALLLPTGTALHALRRAPDPLTPDGVRELVAGK